MNFGVNCTYSAPSQALHVTTCPLQEQSQPRFTHRSTNRVLFGVHANSSIFEHTAKRQVEEEVPHARLSAVLYPKWPQQLIVALSQTSPSQDRIAVWGH
ncbi:unnamed protein product [Chondrus crispus]|uniref:Uncharacterized protein n=1 Tax=Chondrus crispus TaxID=2769 RepID=R7QE54_CHOCR|nr:unnamed protein product [Chondrus crispus]CDF36797.1 unnamed protein product [Chondrus crispus]|eukprot:XP_005716616.1 unnamed protein product [Chondrus crispus]